MIEVLVSISIFMIAMGAMFVLFQKSYQSFHFLEQRQSVQSQVLRITSVLEADFRVTHLGSVGIESRQILVGAENVHRDLISCLGVDDWLDAANFQEHLGVPIWNQYAVYVSDLEQSGKLERLTVARAPGSVSVLGGMTSLAPDTIRSRQTLCDNLLSFECTLEPARQLVNQTIRLRKKGGAARGLDAKATEESFEARFRWMPKNTVPRI